MSDVVIHRRSLSRRGRLRWFHSDPEMLLFDSGRAPEIRFADGRRGKATCLGCHDAPCMELTEAELRLGGVGRPFPGDPSHDVCPTNAISWDEAGEVPTIDFNDCIGCGICAARCPYGAISLGPEGVALVEGDDPDGLTATASDAVGPHVITPRVGTLGNLAAPFVSEIPKILTQITDTQGTRLARNLLIACGVAAAMRRKGDTNIRMDGLVCFGTGQIGVVELETGAAVIESPRALLDDVAVLHSRFSVPLVDIVPISLIGALPNARAEYYQVIDDILKVLDIRCRTITFGALCLVVWHFEKLHGLDGDLFTTQAKATDLHFSLAQLIPDLATAEPYPGAYSPPK